MVKAQMKIQQMAFMLIAVTLLFAFAGIFVLSMKLSGLKNSATMLEQENAMLLVTKLANSPEFSCGESFGGNDKTNCIDIDKAMILKENIAKYSNFWGVSDIEIRKIYPAENRDVQCTINNYPDCNLITLFSTSGAGYDSSNFVSLCRKERAENGGFYDKCELGKLLVRYVEK
jgi:hypothetical protein